MNDKEAAQVLTAMLEKYPLDKEEAEAIRDAIGLLAWTKLIVGWKERKKRARERREGSVND